MGGFLCVSSAVSVFDIGDFGFRWTLGPRVLIPLVFRIHSASETSTESVGVFCVCPWKYSRFGVAAEDRPRVSHRDAPTYLEQVFFQKRSKELIKESSSCHHPSSLETKVTSEQSGCFEFFPLPPTPPRSRENRKLRHLFNSVCFLSFRREKT